MMLAPREPRRAPTSRASPDPLKGPSPAPMMQLPACLGVEAIRDSVHPPRLALLIPTDPHVVPEQDPRPSTEG